MQEMAEVEMHDVEIGGAAPDFVQHRKMRGDRRLQRRGIEPQRLVADRHEPCVGDCVRTGKQGDIMPARHQPIGQVGDDPFGAAIKPWRNGFEQRGDVGNSHRLRHELGSCLQCTNRPRWFQFRAEWLNAAQCGRDALLRRSRCAASLPVSAGASPYLPSSMVARHTASAFRASLRGSPGRAADAGVPRRLEPAGSGPAAAA